MAKRKAARRRAPRRSMPQSLRYSFGGIISTAPATFSASSITLPTDRPAKPTKVAVTYVQSGPTPALMSFYVVSATGEEIYGSPPLVSSSVSKTFVARLPRNTDFGTYAGNGAVIIFRAAIGVTVGVVLDYMFSFPVVKAIVPLALLPPPEEEDGEVDLPNIIQG